MTDGREFFDSNIVSSCHVETVVLLGREHQSVFSIPQAESVQKEACAGMTQAR